MRKRITLKDIAEKLNVSTTLVSYVMNDKVKEGRVGAEMVEKIRQAAKELNYIPNHAAKSLKNKRQMSLGCMVADVSNPFFAELARKVEDNASKYGYTVVISSSDENLEKFQRQMEFMLSRQLDGYIIAPPEGSKNYILELKKAKVPIVLVDRYYPDVGLSCVVIDNFTVSKEIVSRLFEEGRKKIGMISYQSDMHHFELRKQGYLEALHQYGLAEGANLLRKVNYTNLRNEVKEEIDILINIHNVDAIFFETNSLVIEGLKYLKSLGLNIPVEMDIAAFDQSEAYYFFDHPIKYVRQPLETLAKEAVEILINQVEHNEFMNDVKYVEASILTEYEGADLSIKA